MQYQALNLDRIDNIHNWILKIDCNDFDEVTEFAASEWNPIGKLGNNGAYPHFWIIFRAKWAMFFMAVSDLRLSGDQISLILAFRAESSANLTIKLTLAWYA